MLSQNDNGTRNLRDGNSAKCANFQSVEEFGRRVRAARAYAGGLTQDELADAIGLSVATIRRIEGGVRNLREIEEQAYSVAIGEACGLPPEFFSADFRQLSNEPVSNLMETKLDQIIEELKTLNHK